MSEPGDGQAAETDQADIWNRHHDFVERNLKRNYAVNLIHGVFGMTGFRLMFAPTIIPAYLYMLTGSAAMVGLGTALLQLGGILSPVIAGARIEGRNRILPFAMMAGSMVRVMLLGVAIAAWMLDGAVLLWTTLGLFFLLGLFQGGQRVAFNMLMAKVIPINRRGKLQGVRNTLGGVIAAGLAWMAGHYFIADNWFGNGYATTFLLAFILTALGLLALRIGIAEPDAPRKRPSITMRERFGQFAELLDHRGFRAFLIAHGFATIARIGLPFWILYIGDQLGLSGALIGSLSLAFLGADTISNLMWGYLGDRFGFRIVYVGGLVATLAGVALLLSGDALLLHLSFIALGLGSSGWMLAAGMLVLEFGEHEDIPMRLALVGTVEATVSFIGPIMAGVGIAIFGYSPLLAVTFIALGLSLAIVLLQVKEPRTARLNRAR